MQLVDLLDLWWRVMASVSMQAGLLILGVALVSRLCRPSARVRCWLWSLVLVRLAVPIAIETPVGLLPVTGNVLVASAEPTALVPFAASLPETNVKVVPVRPVTEAVERAEWTGAEVAKLVVFALWASGLLNLGLAHARGQARLRRWLSSCRPAEPRVERWVHGLWADLGGRGEVNLRIFDQPGIVKGAAIVGWRKPTLVLPSVVAEGWPRSSSEPVVLHELVHLRRRDAHWNTLLAWIEAVYFFHPLVWFAGSKIRTEREYACDDEVIARQASSLRQYVVALVRLSTPEGDERLGGALAFSRRSRLLPRIRRLVDPGPPPVGRPARSALGVLVIAAILLLAAGRGASILPAPDTDVVEAPTDDAFAAVDEDPRRERLKKLATRWDAAAIEERGQLLLELTAGYPDMHPDQADYLLAFWPESEPELYASLRALWREHLGREPENRRILRNAAEFFSMEEPARALELFSALDALEPGRSEVLLRLGDLHLRLAALGGQVEIERSRATEFYRAAIDASTSSQVRIEALTRASRRLMVARDLTLAAEFAREALLLLEEVPDGSARRLAMHYSPIVLGHLALEHRQEAEAVRQLLLAAEVESSPVLATFGPDLTLANALLRRGWRAEVTEYLQFCRKFWRLGVDRLDGWIEEIGQGRTPRLNRSRPS